LVLRNPFFFGFAIIVLVILQVGMSYLSFRSLLEEDWLLGILFLFFVPGLAFIMVVYFIWFRKNRLSR